MQVRRNIQVVNRLRVLVQTPRLAEHASKIIDNP